MVSTGSIIDEASIGGFELAAGAKKRQHAIVIQGRTASSGDNFIFVDGNGEVTSGSANSQAHTCSFGAGSVTLKASFATGNNWIIGDNRLVRYDDGAGNIIDPDGTVITGSGGYVSTTSDPLDIIMAFGDIAIQPKAATVTKSYVDPVEQTVTAATNVSTSHAKYTVANHGYEVGDIVQVTGSSVADWNALPGSGSGMTGVITHVDTVNDFRIAVNASGFDAFTGTATVKMFTTAGEVSVTSINGGTVNFEVGQSDFGVATLTMGVNDCYRLTLSAFARGGI